MTKKLLVNGLERVVTNAVASGPSSEPTMYELTGGDYVYKVGEDWWFVSPARAKSKATVEFAN